MGKYLNDRQLKLKTEPGRYSAERNLYLFVGKGGARSWSLIYTSRVTGRRREYGLGSAYDIPLAEARGMAEELRPKIAKGFDPIEEKKSAKRQARADATTLGGYVESWIQHRENDLRAGTVRNIRGALKNLPESFTSMRIGEIEAQHVIDTLRPLWR